MESREIQNWRDEQALKRFQMISPLTAEGLDRAKKIALRKQIAADNDISEKTIRRYEAAYHSCGFSGLKPDAKTGHMTSRLPDNYTQLVQEAIQLKREVPTRSVEQIIFILENENQVEPGIMKRSTLQRYLYNAGFGESQMRKYKEDNQTNATKRFCKRNRMMLAQADIKYGVGVLVNKHGKRQTAYLSSIIDDHSRLLLWSEWYENQDEYSVEDVFRKAVLKHGKMDKCYTDNGSVYVSHQLKLSCSMLGIKLIRAKPRSGKSKGKVEKYHQVVDVFIAEIKLQKITEISELNRLWQIFLEEYYHKKPHDGIREYYESNHIPVPEGGISPEQEWNRDSRPLVFMDANVVGEAFRHHEKRNVDRGGTISFKGKKYEVPASLIGAQVQIAFDPGDISTITVSYKDMKPFTAKPVGIGAWCSKTQAIPQAIQEKPASSRFLDVLERKHRESQEKLADAISYGDYRKEKE